jgi:molecular chaperone GrpE
MNPTDPECTDPAPDAPAADPAAEAGDLRARLAVADALAEQHRSAYLRAAADLENYRKRVTREVESARQFGVERLAGGLLPVVDGLELGLANADRADAATLTDGQRATLKLLLKALEGAGIAEVDPLGKPFNPEQHEAMAMQPTAEFPPNTVMAVVQKGYLLNGRLLRPARVVVARAADA